VVRVPTDVTAAQRARWLAELTDALDEAQTLVWRLGVSEMRQIEAFDLLARLEAARAEARSLQLSRLREIASPSGPEWTNPLWDSAQPKCCA
jgi:hypothetical protein